MLLRGFGGTSSNLDATTVDWQVNRDYDGHADRAIFADAILLEDLTLLSTSATFMPWRRQSFATARPMPDAAPVMRAVLPALKTGLGGVVMMAGG